MQSSCFHTEKIQYFLKKLIFLQIHIDIFFWKVYFLNYGSQSEEVIPVPIPNTEVKLFYADDTANAGK